MNKNIHGIFIPKQLMEELQGSPVGKGLEIPNRYSGQEHQSDQGQNRIDGEHTVVMCKKEVVPRILDLAGINK
jgi:hypothetical protein